MVIPWTWSNAFCNPWRVIFLLNIVNDDVLHFVWEMTKRKWFYRYHYMRRYLMIFDRLAEIEYAGLFVLYYRESFPHWDICLGIYIALRLISFAMYSNTKLFRCYAVRTVLPTIISGVFCSVTIWVPCILAWNNEALVIVPVCDCLVRCTVYIVVLINTYRQLYIVDLDITDYIFEIKEDRWVYRYHVNRRFTMIFDRLFDIFVIGLFIFYYLKSIPHWPVCLALCIFSRLISFALYSNFTMWKCYAARTALSTILSVFCMVAAWVPFILAWRNEIFVMLPFGIFLVTSGSYVLAFLVACSKFR